MKGILKTKIASVFVLAFIAVLMGSVAAFASTDIDEPQGDPQTEFGIIAQDVNEDETDVDEEDVDSIEVEDEEDAENIVQAFEEIMPAAVLTPQATVTGYCGVNVTWQLDESGTLTLKPTNSSIAQTMYDFPNEADDQATLLDGKADPSLVKKIVVMLKITNIGNGAFKDFVNLKEVVLSTGDLLTIGESAFEGCTSLLAIAIPQGVQTIGANAFRGCRDLSTIGLPLSIAHIEDGAFSDCPYIQDVNYAGPFTAWAQVDKGNQSLAFDEAVKTTDSFTVTFHPYPDTNQGTYAKMTGTDFILHDFPADPVRDGYTFVGWFTSQGARILSSTKFTQNSDAYARWTEGEQRYTITFSPNGGKINNAVNYVNKTTTDGKLAEFPPDATRDGYTFAGWWTTMNGATDGGIEYSKDSVFTKSMMLYAVWTPKPTEVFYTITFDPNGGSFKDLQAPVTRKTTTDNTLASGLPTAIEREGYEFLGWFTDPENGTKISTSTPFDGDKTVYAQWKKNETSNPNTGDNHGDDNPGNTPSTPSNPTTPGTVSYKVLEGANSSYTLNKGASLTVRADGELGKFVALLVDGKELTRETHYTVKSGSVIATIKNAFLDTLSEGSHRLTFKYNDGEASTSFAVAKAPAVPDNTNPSTPTDPGSSAVNTQVDATVDGASSASANQDASGAAKGASGGSGNPDTGDVPYTAAVYCMLFAALTLACQIRRRRVRLDG